MNLTGGFAFGGQPIASRTAHLRVADGALLLDVRTREEFAQRQLAGSMNIPAEELEQRIRDLPAGTRSIVVYCRTGSRSSKAASLLRSYGYEVHDLGSIGNW